MNDIYDEFSDLLGAYALDAVDPDERDRIERHLAECPRCRAEVADHREVAALLSRSGAPAPEGVWDKISAELAPPAPPLRMTFSSAADDDLRSAGQVPTPAPATVTPLSEARSARNGRTLWGLLAVAACIVAVLGFVTVSQSQRINKVETALEDATIEGMANDAVASSPVKVSLTGEGGNAEAVVGKDGQGFLIMDEVPEPADGDVYQLWGKVDGVVLSLGTFGTDREVVPFSVDPGRVDDIELFAITQEKAPGVIESVNQPVMAGTV